MDTVDGVEGVWDAGVSRMRAEEVKGLEALVGGMERTSAGASASAGGSSSSTEKQEGKENGGEDPDAMDTT